MLPRNARQRHKGDPPAIKYRRPPEPINRRDWLRYERSERLTNTADDLRLEYARPFRERDQIRIEKLMSGLDRSQKAYVQFLVGRGKKSELDPDDYIKAFNLTSPVVVAPTINHDTRAFALTWSSDILKSFYTAWWDDEIRQRDEAGYEASKAVMAIAAGTRSSPDIKTANDDADEKDKLSALFVELAAEGGRAIEWREYSAVTRHLDRLATVVNELAPKYASEITQELATLFPKAPIGRFFSADGNRPPAWVRQVSGKVNGVFDPEREAWLTRNHPEAKYGYYSYGQKGSEVVGEETVKTVQPGGKAVRGHHFVLCSEVLTQITLAQRGFPGNFYEPDSIHDLMPTIFENWNEIPAQFLVADKLWHKRPSHEDLLRRWDMHLVAIPSEDALKRVAEITDKKYRGGAATIRGDGVVVCKHGNPCAFVNVDVPSRKSRELAGIELGEPMDERLYRYRVYSKCCGRLNLPMRLDWRALTALPNHNDGGHEKYALRLALQGHRNISEAGFASLQVAHKLLGKDGTRSRLQKNRNEALLWLALLTKAGHLLTAERIHRGLMSPDLPNDSLRLLEAA